MEEQGKKLNIWNIIGLGLGGAIGTGIFVLLGYGTAYAGRSISLVVVVGCFFMLLAYWYNLAMPMMFVLRGGDYSMKNMMFTPLVTGASAWFTVIGAFAMSGYAVAIADYLIIVIPALAGFKNLIAFLVMTLFFAASIRGSRFLTLLENGVTILLIAALTLFVVFGLPQVDYANYLSSTYDGGFFHGGFGGFVAAIAVMGWACQGTTMAPIAMAAVTKNPKRTIPFGIIIITCLLAVVYGLMGIVAGGVLPYEAAAGQNISVVAEAILPTGLYLFFVVGGGIGAVASSLLGGIGMYRYPLAQVAEDGWLPAVFKRQTSSGYPYLTYLVFYLVSIFPIVTGLSLDAIVSLVMIPTMLFNIYMNIACVTLPKKYPEQWEKRSVKMPVWFYDVCCILGAFCAGVVAYNLFVDLNLMEGVLCVVIVAACLLLSEIRLQQGAVKKEDLIVKREAIIADAITMTAAEDAAN